MEAQKLTTYKACPDCTGDHFRSHCPRCAGTGLVKHSERIVLRMHDLPAEYHKPAKRRK